MADLRGGSTVGGYPVIHTGNINQFASRGIFGSSTFAGNSVARTIAHGLGIAPSHVSITPSANPGATLGTVWYTADATNVNIYNSGAAVTAFTYAIFK